MIWVHRALLAAAALGWLLASFYAVRALTGRPHRARRAARVGMVAFVLFLADTLGRAPVALRAAEEAGRATTIAFTTLDLAIRHGIPVTLWGAALFGRWRGWLADKVFATAVLIAAAATALAWAIPLPR